MDEEFNEDAELEGLEQYAIVASRRQQRYTLLWQMPTMALTGEAFLFTISLGGATSEVGRIVASMLALVVAISSLHSLSAHRLSELADSDWLHEYDYGAALRRSTGSRGASAGWRSSVNNCSRRS